MLVVELASVYRQPQLCDASFQVHVLDWSSTKSPWREERAQKFLQPLLDPEAPLDLAAVERAA